jgi:hypothetical protein
MLRTLLVVGLAVGLSAVTTLWILARREPSASAGSPTSPEPSSAPPGAVQDARSPSSSSLPRVRPPDRRLTEPRRRELLRRLESARVERVNRARGRTPAASTAASDDHAPSAPLSLADKTGSSTDWEKRQVEILNELLAECYDLAASEQPGLSGTLGVSFRITGEPAVGGVVEAVELLDDHSTIRQSTMRECVTESLYALELAPPPEGVSVGRQITLRFDPE